MCVHGNGVLDLAAPSAKVLVAEQSTIVRSSADAAEQTNHFLVTTGLARAPE